MRLSAKNSFERYGVAVLAVAVSMGVRLTLAPLLGPSVPFIILYPAVAIAAIYGGARAGLFTTFAGAAAAVYFVIEPHYSFDVLGTPEVVQVTLFVLMGGLISWMVGDRQKITATLENVRTETDRQTREAAEALRESKERARLAESSVSVGIWEWDFADNKVEWSEGIYELLGYEPFSIEASVDVWQKAMLPEELAHAQDVIKRFTDGGSPDFYDEFRLKRDVDGRVVWLATKGKIIREDGQAVRLFGVNYDITEIKEKELKIVELNRELRRRVSELQTIFDLTPVGVAVALDADCTVITANPALAQMVGVKAGDNISSNSAVLPYKHLKNGKVLKADELPMQRAVAERRAIVNEELEIERADGGRITIYSYAAPVFDPSGDVISCVAAQIDITERKQQELKREHALGTEQALRREAEEANRLKDEFLATISHELRTPLNSIMGWTSMLRDPSINDDLRARAVAAVDRGAKAQSQLIEDLLDVSRIISGKLELRIKPVEMHAVAAAAIETLRPAAAAREITVTLHAEPATEIVAGDRDRLQQIVWNLLSNAIKFTPKGGRVDVGLNAAGGEVVLTVADTGQGISADFLPLVFDRFRQADGSITRNFTGLGLGLSIVRHLVELHGGTVGVESEGPDRGSVFTVRLPAVVPESPQPEDRTVGATEQQFPVLYGLRVLVVDDEQDTRDILKLAFERHGVSVTCAGSADEALKLARAHMPQLIISDIGMPGRDGYDLLAMVREWEREVELDAIPSIALTAYAGKADRERAFDAGFRAHVAKPVDPQSLLDVVRDVITAGRDDRS